MRSPKFSHSKYFSPARWSIAWRVRLGLIVVPLFLSVLAFYQFTIANATMDIYRVIVDDVDQVRENVWQMKQNGDQMENYVRALQLETQSRETAKPNTPGTSITREQAFRRSYDEARSKFELACQDAIKHAWMQPALRDKIEDYHQKGLEWQRRVGERFIQKFLMNDQAVTVFDEFHPFAFDEGDGKFKELQDALFDFRKSERTRANRFRLISNIGLLLAQGLALVLAMWIGMSLARQVTGPLQQLVEQSRRIAAGEYSPTPTTRQDEFGQVIGAVNSMSAAIQARLEREILVNRITAAITRSLDYDTVLQTTVKEIGEALRASRCFIRLFADKGEEG
ncbi:MAG: HAMP domain-containing protein, partial [Armatimonadota bacterium]|nr:HAMP domain-containing protein [Armatimonadota bacterium]